MKKLFGNLKKAVSGLTNIVEQATSGNADLSIDNLKKTVNELTGKLENTVSNNPNLSAEGLKKTVSGLTGKLGEVASAAINGAKVKPEASMVVSALEKTPIKATPLSTNKLYLTVEATDTVPEDWYVLVDMSEERIQFTTAIEADLAEKFKTAGFDAVYKQPLTMVSHEIKMKDISGTKELKKLVTELVERQQKVIEEFAKTDEYIITMLDVMVFDCQYIGEKMKQSKYFKKIDEEGDIQLEAASTNECMYNRFVWVMPKPDRLILDCGITGVTYPDNLESIAKEMEAKSDGIKFKVSEGKLRLKAYIDPEDYPAEDIPERIFKTIETTVEKLLSTWVEILKKMGARVSADQFFDVSALRDKLKTIPNFRKKDDDGDLEFRIDGDANFQPTRFAWIILKKDRVSISGGILNYSNAGATVEPEEVVKKFNKANHDLEAFLSDGTVRVHKNLSLDDYNSANPTEKVVKDVKYWYGKVLDSLTSVASLAGMKVNYYRPDLKWMESRLNKEMLGKVSLGNQELIIQLKPTKTTAGDLLTTATMTVKATDSAANFELKVELEKSCDNSETLKVANQFAPALAKTIHKPVNCKGGNYSIFVTFTVPNNTLDTAKDFSDIYFEGIQALMNIESKASDLVLEAYNREIREKRERERRRQEEERERERRRQAEATAAREKELDAGFTYTLRSSGTIRRLQEGFTEDYPYLRIGVFMVKTGQKADRSGGTITSYDSDATFGNIRSFKGDCKVRIEGRSTPESLEKQFRDVSGLVIKICYNDETDHRYYISKGSSWYKTPICDLNREFRAKGYYKADIS